MNYKSIIKRQSFIITISIIVMAIILIGASYALFNNTNASTQNQVVESGTLIIDYSASTGVTNTGDANNEIIPESDADMESASGYNINITNTGTLPMSYDLIIYTGNTNGVMHSAIKVQLDSGEVKTLSSLPKTGATATETNMNNIRYVLGSSTVGASNPNDDSDVKNHSVKVWIDENADESIIGENIQVLVSVEGIVEGSE